MGVAVNDVNRSTTEPLTLSHQENKLTVRYEAISFKHNADIVYRYQLNNRDEKDQWNYTRNLSITFPELNPGTYELVLQASIDELHWGKTINLPFTISPPYYATLWFKALIIIVVVLLIYLFFRIRVLTYNRDVVREIIRLVLKKLKRQQQHIVIREAGMDLKINSQDILYVRSADNYIEIYTSKKKYAIRQKISEFLTMVPDPLEYIRIHRSYIVRIDHVQAKSSDSVTIADQELKVSKTYQKELAKIQF